MNFIDGNQSSEKKILNLINGQVTEAVASVVRLQLLSNNFAVSLSEMTGSTREQAFASVNLLSQNMMLLARLGAPSVSASLWAMNPAAQDYYDAAVAFVNEVSNEFGKSTGYTDEFSKRLNKAFNVVEIPDLMGDDGEEAGYNSAMNPDVHSDVDHGVEVVAVTEDSYDKAEETQPGLTPDNKVDFS